MFELGIVDAGDVGADAGITAINLFNRMFEEINRTERVAQNKIIYDDTEDDPNGGEEKREFDRGRLEQLLGHVRATDCADNNDDGIAHEHFVENR